MIMSLVIIKQKMVGNWLCAIVVFAIMVDVKCQWFVQINNWGGGGGGESFLNASHNLYTSDYASKKTV